MKKGLRILLALYIFLPLFVFSQTNQWIWMGGDSIPGNSDFGEYGSNSHCPGARTNSNLWADTTGNIWLFSGQGYGHTTFTNLNDVWKLDTHDNQWIWVDGDKSFQYGSYGTQGSATASNHPGGRRLASQCQDSLGTFWVFGGRQGGEESGPQYNDLWKYNPTTEFWTWISGSDTTQQFGVYGTMGTGTSSTKPGSRSSAATWIDNQGIFWLFGGYGNAASNVGYLNDLWKYNPTTNIWTWMKGSNQTYQFATYGTMGTGSLSNKPGARIESVQWVDSNGNLWLFGGLGNTNSSSTGNLNDLWKYTISTNKWTWIGGSSSLNPSGIFGTLGTGSSTNIPSGRQNATNWVDENHTFWLFGGANSLFLSDLWKYNSTTNIWTWMSGDSIGGQYGKYGIKGEYSSLNSPGSRQGSSSACTNDGKLWLFGGRGLSSVWNNGYLNDLWVFDIDGNAWTWVSGDSIVNAFGIYGIKGSAASNPHPSKRESYSYCTDENGKFWLFGGAGLGAAGNTGEYLNDLWMFDPLSDAWIWKSGLLEAFNSNNGYFPVIGKVIPRHVLGASMQYANGGLYIFGGHGQDAASTTGDINTLWFYDISNDSWTKISGSDTCFSQGIHGAQGQSSSTNNPSARNAASSWIAGDNLYLFGGFRNQGNDAFLNDLWRYNFNSEQWTWMKGSIDSNQVTNYGTHEVEDSTNVPGGRYGVGYWTDDNADLWMFGGYGYGFSSLGLRSDLWKYVSATNNWVWMKGDSLNGNNYGTQGVSASTNLPPARSLTGNWTDDNGDLWMFGGSGGGYRNDMWNYNLSSGNWTWVNGSSVTNQLGSYGAIGIASSTNIPGARVGQASWKDSQGNLWLWGSHYGYGSSGGPNHQSDFWQYNIGMCNPSFSSYDTTVCDSLVWFDGNTYTTSNNSATYILTNSTGCDSIITLDLTVHATSSTTEVITACGYYIWVDGNTYYTSNNTATYTVPNQNGCDSTSYLDLTVLPTTSGGEIVHICFGEGYEVGGQMRYTNGIYYDTLNAANGCDSIVTIFLLVHKIKTVKNKSICSGDSIFIYDRWVSQSGTYIDTLTSIYGCDSILQTNLTAISIDTSVSAVGQTLIASETSASSFQWIDCASSNPIIGETLNSFTPLNSGVYQVKIAKSNCMDSSLCRVVYVPDTSIDSTLSISEIDQGLKVYPNPVVDFLTIDFGAIVNPKITIYSSTGQIVYYNGNIPAPQFRIQLNVASGSYILHIETNEKNYRYRILKI